MFSETFNRFNITLFVDKSTKGSPFQAIQVATSVCLANDA